MSRIAKSLKKLRETERVKQKAGVSASAIVGRFSSNIGIYAVGLIIAIFAVAIEVFSIYRLSFKYNRSFSRYPSIVSLEKRIGMAKKFMNYKSKEIDFDYYLSLGMLDKLFELAKRYHNLKYEGIYFAKIGEYEKALNLLKDYLKVNPQDDEARVFVAEIYYNEGKYNRALAILDGVKLKDYRIWVDRAVVYERMGNIRQALDCYEKAVNMSSNAIVKSKIKVKIIALKFYLRNSGGF